jgi:integrase
MADREWLDGKDHGFFRRQKKDGSYSWGFTYTEPGGKTKWPVFPTITQAKAAKRAIATDLDRDEYTPKTKLTFEEYARDWLATYTGRGSRTVKPLTVKDYARVLELHVFPAIGRKRLSAVTPMDLEKLAHSLGTEKKLSANTVRNALAPVRAIFRKAAKQRLISHDPTSALDLPSAPPSAKPKHLEADELARLHQVTPEEWRLWLRLLVYSGARIGEYMALTWADIDLTTGTLSIVRRRYRGALDTPKSVHGTRTIPLTPDLVLALKKHRLADKYSGDADPVFASRTGSPLQESNLRRQWFDAATERAGIPWASYHTLRHTCGTMLARAGRRPEEIQAWLGHHAASFSLDVYVGKPKPESLIGVDLLAGDMR